MLLHCGYLRSRLFPEMQMLGTGGDRPGGGEMPVRVAIVVTSVGKRLEGEISSQEVRRSPTRRV